MSKNLQKIRADLLLVEQGVAPTRTRAQSLVMSGQVYAGTRRIEKASELLHPAETLIIKGVDHPYVGRGGLKLEAALQAFPLSVKDCVCLDVGASTGGFTDCLLKQGAKKVYALDVGYGQLAWSLQQDPRVTVMDRTNFRLWDVVGARHAVSLPDIDIITMDVSFISVMKLIPKVIEVFNFFKKEGGIFIVLIKPQFEVGREFIGKKGVVKDQEKQNECVEKVRLFCQKEGFDILGVIPSPILGQEGNKEFLMAGIFHATKPHLY